MRVLSAHRTPAEVAELRHVGARARATPRSSAAPGWPPTSPGAVAAHTTLPVVGVPLSGGALNGVDALYATVQMPTGHPGRHRRHRRGVNAALLVVEMLAITDDGLAEKLADDRRRQAAIGVSD